MRCRVGVLLALLSAEGFASAQSTVTVKQLRDDLHALSESLRYNSGTHATYAPIEKAVLKAHSTLSALSAEKPGAIPQAAAFSETLDRLIAESRYLVNLSSAKGYKQDFLDSQMFLTGAVDEWRFTINGISAKLEQPSKYRHPRPGRSSAGNISGRTRPGTVFRDAKNAPDMVVIPTGCFHAGTSREELQRWKVPANTWKFEQPQREVCIASHLAVGRTEVTLEQFEMFVNSTGYEMRGGARWFGNPPTTMVFDAAINYRNPGFPQTKNDPVVAIRWQDAKAYADWLSTVTGQTYRLPTEDEWEWAARGGSQTTFFWGNETKEINRYANVYDYSTKRALNFPWPPVKVEDGFPFTAPVASFMPNGFGLYDITGNAREFVADSWMENTGTAANDGTAHNGPVQFRVVRGGAWCYNERNYRINYRDGYFSSEVATYMFGFRLVREL
ncbi:Formylglycine-proteinrating enzyme [Conoideocrella luteorostrata]|uniref:Formylglycine-proteinrating enzyme n=1 Tax=Conoideocrella luteorostrata TaxID=1105319 RepID=A0AAJ0CZF3_9HYPO|nr:Formylglycine-proteinrating enzyme [Conoideocrella luteorostrata]